MSTSQTSAPNRKRRTAWIVGAAALVVAVVIFLVISFTPGSAKDDTAMKPTGAASTSPSTATTPPPTVASAPPATTPPAPVLAVPLPPADQAAAELNVKDFMAARAQALAAPVPDPANLQELAIGSAYDAMMANAGDFINNGWHQVGTPTVASIIVTGYEPSATPPQATLNVCVDSSAVTVLTADGTVVKAGTAGDRSMNILTVVLSGGKWLVSQESFPADPSC